jgi:adenine-specific DNA methylase
MPPQKLLIESWLPIEAIGAECKRENSTGQHPPPNRLHVWWARRPLIACRAAILAGVLPAWSPGWPEPLHSKFPDEHTYHQWFLQLIGISGDPAQARKLIDWANAKSIRLDFNPYGGSPRAFTVNPSDDDLATMQDLLEITWGSRDLNVLDPFAGGGSIPFEALRFGFTTVANDLNPVAAVILKATLDYPARFGLGLADDIRKWGNIWAERVKEKLAPYFPKQKGENIFAYLWARTVACPATGKPVPLSPNWWLSKDPPVAVKMTAESWMDEPRFEIVKGAQAVAAKPDEGTISRGVARSPWTGQTVDGDYIKAEAQAGRMGQMLYAVATKVPGGFEFRAPNVDDKEAIKRLEKAFTERKSEWIAKNIIPSEPFPEGNDNRPLMYGMPTWADFFSPRQLLSMGVFVETLHETNEIVSSRDDKVKADAITTFLGLALSKCSNYSSYLSSWHAPRTVMRSVFDRHDFSFKWAYGEFDAAANLLPWAINQIYDAYRDLASLAAPSQTSFITMITGDPEQSLTITRSSASDQATIEDDSIFNITVDPPYYDNVQYAELSDFFYVWLKRSVGHLFPEFFTDELTNKDDEAVANPARFEGIGKSKKELAKQDYERKMLAAFREMHRVLHPDGCLTVMFTHKKVEAWDTLATALINAGFTIQASWPVHTESEHSLHQAKKNAASSTILLACRKRLPSPTGRGAGGEVWWDDLQSLVRQTARQKAEQFAAQGMHGVDLYLSTFGPTLSIISEHWPVLTSEVDPKTGQPKTLRPETALDLAREEVVRLRKQGLLLGRDIQFDPVTDWYLMAWDAFAAEQFPYDEARKLAIALGVDLDHDLMAIERLAVKKGEFVTLQKPVERRKRGMVDEDARSFEHWIDAAHTAMMIYSEDGAGPCEVFLRESGLRRDGTFKALIQALLNAIPRTRIKGKFLRPEAEVLENMRLAFFDDLAAPVEEEPEMPKERQMTLREAPGGYGFEVDEEEDES